MWSTMKSNCIAGQYIPMLESGLSRERPIHFKGFVYPATKRRENGNAA